MGPPTYRALVGSVRLSSKEFPGLELFAHAHLDTLSKSPGTSLIIFTACTFSWRLLGRQQVNDRAIHRAFSPIASTTNRASSVRIRDLIPAMSES